MRPDDRVSPVLPTKETRSLLSSAGAVINRLAPPPDSSIAIYGLGAVGMSAILAAAHLQVRTIIAIDLVPARLEIAREFGATHTLDARAPDLVAQVRALTRNAAGSDYTVEASGNMRAFRNAYEATAPGGHMTSAGTPGPGVKPDFDIFEHVCTAKIYSAVLMGCCYPREVSRARANRRAFLTVARQFVPFLIDLHRQGKFPIEKISRKYTPQEFDQAVHDM
jgi:aryl-alcohol dehydrogenase